MQISIETPLALKIKSYDLDNDISIPFYKLDFDENGEALLQEAYHEETDEDSEYTEQVYIFAQPKALTRFLLCLINFTAQELTTCSGDDSYFDYNPNMMEQYHDILDQLKAIKLPTDIWDYKVLTNTITLSIEYYNMLLAHQDPDESHCNDSNYWFCSNLEPIIL